MRIAIPILADVLAPAFGQTAVFALFDVDNDTRAITPLENHVLANGLGDGSLAPLALQEWAVEVVITHVIEPPALKTLNHLGILVIAGAPSEPPAEIVHQLTTGTLLAQRLVCDTHNADHCCGGADHPTPPASPSSTPASQ